MFIRSQVADLVVDVAILELRCGTSVCVTAAVETEEFFQGGVAFSGWSTNQRQISVVQPTQYVVRKAYLQLPPN
jgi:hypothetical protein